MGCERDGASPAIQAAAGLPAPATSRLLCRRSSRCPRNLARLTFSAAQRFDEVEGSRIVYQVPEGTVGTSDLSRPAISPTNVRSFGERSAPSLFEFSSVIDFVLPKARRPPSSLDRPR